MMPDFIKCPVMRISGNEAGCRCRDTLLAALLVEHSHLARFTDDVSLIVTFTVHLVQWYRGYVLCGFVIQFSKNTIALNVIALLRSER